MYSNVYFPHFHNCKGNVNGIVCAFLFLLLAYLIICGVSCKLPSCTLCFQAVFGVLRVMEGLQSFDDMMEHTKVKNWYRRMQKVTQQVS